MPDLIATSGEYLRLWEISSITGEVGLGAELKNVIQWYDHRQKNQNSQHL